METSRKIRFVLWPIIIIALIAILGFGPHGNIAFNVCISIVFAVVYFTAFEQFVTLITSFMDRKNFVSWGENWIGWVGKPVLLLKPFFIFYLHWNVSAMIEVTPAVLYAAAEGAVIVVIGAVFSILTMRAWSTMFVGHGITENHKLIISGIYSRVRNPIYLADCLYWIGLSIGTLSIVAAVITAVYVIPYYIIYIKGEEDMLLKHFGDEYNKYMQNVPRLIPAFRAYKINDGN